MPHCACKNFSTPGVCAFDGSARAARPREERIFIVIIILFSLIAPARSVRSKMTMITSIAMILTSICRLCSRACTRRTTDIGCERGQTPARLRLRALVAARRYGERARGTARELDTSASCTYTHVCIYNMCYMRLKLTSVVALASCLCRNASFERNVPTSIHTHDRRNDIEGGYISS